MKRINAIIIISITLVMFGCDGSAGSIMNQNIDRQCTGLKRSHEGIGSNNPGRVQPVF